MKFCTVDSRTWKIYVIVISILHYTFITVSLKIAIAPTIDNSL